MFHVSLQRNKVYIFILQKFLKIPGQLINAIAPNYNFEKSGFAQLIKEETSELPTYNPRNRPKPREVGRAPKSIDEGLFEETTTNNPINNPTKMPTIDPNINQNQTTKSPKQSLKNSSTFTPNEYYNGNNPSYNFCYYCDIGLPPKPTTTRPIRFEKNLPDSSFKIDKVTRTIVKKIVRGPIKPKTITPSPNVLQTTSSTQSTTPASIISFSNPNFKAFEAVPS